MCSKLFDSIKKFQTHFLSVIKPTLDTDYYKLALKEITATIVFKNKLLYASVYITQIRCTFTKLHIYSQKYIHIYTHINEFKDFLEVCYHVCIFILSRYICRHVYIWMHKGVMRSVLCMRRCVTKTQSKLVGLRY